MHAWPGAQAQPPSRQPVTAAQYEQWKKQISNWGRWGAADEIGTMNLITPAKRREAARLVRDGESVSLSSDADTVKAVDNPNPYEVTMQGIASDRLAINYHGITHTHLDSLAHINENGVFYNGYKPDPEAVARDRHAKNSIHNFKNGIFTRGVLIDIAAAQGRAVSSSPARRSTWRTWRRGRSAPASRSDRVTRCSFAPACGRAARLEGPWLRGRAEGGRSAGLDPSVIPWLRQRDVALLGSDHPQYVSPGEAGGAPRGAVHDFALVYLGMPLFDNCDLEALADAAAARSGGSSC